MTKLFYLLPDFQKRISELKALNILKLSLVYSKLPLIRPPGLIHFRKGFRREGLITGIEKELLNKL